jgi:hypothetical protein
MLGRDALKNPLCSIDKVTINPKKYYKMLFTKLDKNLM